MKENTRSFSYLYTAQAQQADEVVRRRYHLPADAGISDELRNAPLREQKASLRLAMVTGACSLLVFGAGLSLILTMQSAWTYPLGLLLGTAGLVGMLSMPMSYRKILERKRRQTEKSHQTAVQIMKERNPV